MKIEVFDYIVKKKSKQCSVIIPFCISSNRGEKVESAAEIDMSALSFFAERIPPVAYAFLYFASIVYAIDRSVSRKKYSIDGWSRELDVVFKLPSHKVFEQQKDQIDQLLSFLTGDYWSASFCEASHIEVLKYKDSTYYDSVEQVNLFSGGLDSLIGAIDYMTENPNKKLFLASHYDSAMGGPLSDQTKLLHHFWSEYKGLYVKLPQTHAVRIISKVSAETTCRSRSLVFIAIALQVAAFRDVAIVIPENGSVSLNFPLSPSRRSSCSTRTTHPVVLHQLRNLFKKWGISTKIENPYELMTKGDMVKMCKNQSYLLSILQDANSCGKRTRHQFFYDNKHATHCGHCMPCMYRKASLVGYHDGTSYGNTVNSLYTKKRLQLTDDFFAMLNFLKKDLSEEDILRELRITKVSELPNYEQYVDLVVRTRLELKTLIAEEGSNELKHYIGLL